MTTTPNTPAPAGIDTGIDLSHLTRYGVGGDGELQEMVCGDAYLVADVAEMVARASASPSPHIGQKDERAPTTAAADFEKAVGEWLGARDYYQDDANEMVQRRWRDVVQYVVQPSAALAQAAPTDLHPDDVAVDRFATEMKAKMARSRAKGRGGWEDKAACTALALQTMLVEHLAKGDPIDIGNFAMMLWNRGEQVAAPVSQPQSAICQGAAQPAGAPEDEIISMTRRQYQADRNECFRLGEIEGRDSAAQPAGAGAPSIDTIEFQALAGTWCGASQSCDQWTRTVGAKQAWSDLIAHIDAHIAHIARQGAAPAQAEPVGEKGDPT